MITALLCIRNTVGTQTHWYAVTHDKGISNLERKVSGTGDCIQKDSLANSLTCCD